MKFVFAMLIITLLSACGAIPPAHPSHEPVVTNSSGKTWVTSAGTPLRSRSNRTPNGEIGSGSTF